MLRAENVNEFRFAVQRFSAVACVLDAEAEETDRGAFFAEPFVRACPRSVTLRYVTLHFCFHFALRVCRQGGWLTGKVKKNP